MFISITPVNVKMMVFMPSPGPVVQSVASQIPDQGVVSSILAQSYTFMVIDHEKFSTVILLLQERSG